MKLSFINIWDEWFKNEWVDLNKDSENKRGDENQTY